MRMKFKTISCIFLSLVFLLGIFTPTVSARAPQPGALKCREDGSFTILQFTDTQDTHLPSPNMISLLQKAMDEVKPDLVVFTGDQLKNYDSDFKYGGHDWKSRKALTAIIKPVVLRGIPFAVAFGNHDSLLDYSLEEQVRFLQKFPGCLVIDEGPDVSGCGNYNLHVLNSAGEGFALNLYFLDSNQSLVLPDQIEYYRQMSDALKTQNGGVSVPSIEFQHIVPHSDDLIDAFAEQGDVFASFFGHNHYRSDSFTEQGIEFFFTPTAGFYEFGPDRERGARVIKYNENAPRTVETYVLTFNDLFDDNPITDCRYMLFTIGEMDGDPWPVVVKVVTTVAKAFFYFQEATCGRPIAALAELMQFFGFDIGLFNQ